jgi:hypothetical protein
MPTRARWRRHQTPRPDLTVPQRGYQEVTPELLLAVAVGVDLGHGAAARSSNQALSNASASWSVSVEAFRDRTVDGIDLSAKSGSAVLTRSGQRLTASPSVGVSPIPQRRRVIQPLRLERRNDLHQEGINHRCRGYANIAGGLRPEARHPSPEAEGSGMATGETGFSDVIFDLVSVQYHALKAVHDYG